MKRVGDWVCAALLVGCPLGVFAQPAAKTATVVPRLVKFSGTLTGSAGKPLTGVQGVTFSVYEEQRGGSSVWMETQNVQADATGRYTVMLGSTRNEGIPAEVFASGQGRWLGVQAEGEAEQPRTLLVSVPYALKAVDAETLGGLPASAYALAGASNREGAAPAGGIVPQAGNASTAGAAKPNLSGTGTASYVPLWTNSTTLGTSVLYQSSGNLLGVGTTSPTASLEVATHVADAVALAGVGNGSGGVGVEGSGAAYGVVGATNTSTGVAVKGVNGSASGNTIGVYGGASSSTGTGVWGQALATSGASYGVVGETNSADIGIGVYGSAPGTSGAGVAGYATSATGSTDGVAGTSASTSGAGVWGSATATSGTASGVTGLSASTSGYGVYGSATATSGGTAGVGGYSASTSGAAVYGSETATSGSNSGVSGYSASTSGYGVYGYATATTGYAYGVEGTSVSTSGVGVYGIDTATSGSTIGVYGTIYSPTGVGVRGIGVTASAEGGSHNPTAIGPPGVWGDSQAGFGIVGTSDYTTAVAAYGAATSSATLYAENDATTNSSAVVLATYSPHYGGYCDIFANGNLQCSGSVGGHAVLENTRDVALYGVQAAESWMEDAGSGQLRNGATVVQLEAEFAQTVNTSMDYHVFLTPRGDCKGLYVGQTTPTSFEVHELGGGTTNVGFDYRIMARRKGFENIRLADMTGKIDRGPSSKANAAPMGMPAGVHPPPPGGPALGPGGAGPVTHLSAPAPPAARVVK